MSTEQITIRLPVERVAVLREGAKAGTRSLAQEVEHLLKQNDALTDRCAELEAELEAERSVGYMRAMQVPTDAELQAMQKRGELPSDEELARQDNPMTVDVTPRFKPTKRA